LKLESEPELELRAQELFSKELSFLVEEEVKLDL